MRFVACFVYSSAFECSCSQVGAQLFAAKQIGTEASLHKEEAERLRQELRRLMDEANERIDKARPSNAGSSRVE